MTGVVSGFCHGLPLLSLILSRRVTHILTCIDVASVRCVPFVTRPCACEVSGLCKSEKVKHTYFRNEGVSLTSFTSHLGARMSDYDRDGVTERTERTEAVNPLVTASALSVTRAGTEPDRT